jgi:hypothetical protein
METGRVDVFTPCTSFAALRPLVKAKRETRAAGLWTTNEYC